jgi:hypothetical protein
MTISLEELESKTVNASVRRKLDGLSDEIKQERRKEQTRRSVSANQRAMRALCKLHPNDYDELRRQASVVVEAEGGPLPGDDLLSEPTATVSNVAAALAAARR